MKKGSVVLNKSNGRIAYRFQARDLHLVMGPSTPGTSVRFRVLIDGQPPVSAHGTDVDDQGNGTVSEQRLYQLIRQSKPITDRLFEIEFLDPGAEGLFVHVRLICEPILRTIPTYEPKQPQRRLVHSAAQSIAQLRNDYSQGE